jgi:hypothetical protein
MAEQDPRYLPQRPESSRYEGNNVHRGHILPKGEWVNEYGSRFTPTGVSWSKEEAAINDRMDREEQGY